MSEEAHIVPGGELMHIAQTLEGLARSGLEMIDVENLRPSGSRAGLPVLEFNCAGRKGQRHDQQRAEGCSPPRRLLRFRLGIPRHCRLRLRTGARAAPGTRIARRATAPDPGPYSLGI